MDLQKPMIKPHNLPIDLGKNGNDARYLQIYFYYVEGYCIPHDEFMKEILGSFIPGGEIIAEVVKAHDV